MPSNNLTFYKNNFTAASPSNIPEGEYNSSLRFSTVTKTLKIDPSNHSSHKFTLSNLSGDYDYGSISFSTNNGSQISVKSSNNELYLLQIPDSTIEFPFKDEDGFNSDMYTTEVITNGENNGLTEYLNIHISLAHKKTIPASNTTLTLTHICDFKTVYTYTTGLHVYSPYDAQPSESTLTTKLYSFSEIDFWGVNTRIYSTPFLSQPALPYWYGYGNKLFRVGSEWSRSYGLQDYMVIRKKRFRRPKTKYYTRGPLETYNAVTDTSEACIEPVFGDTGKIKSVITNPSLNQPTQYRYYLGYNNTNKRNSHDDFFKSLSYEKRKSYPITGFQHALNKLPRGIISGFYEGVRINIFPLLLVGAVGGGIAAIGAANIVKFGVDVVAFFDGLVGPLLPTFLQGGLGAAIGNVMASVLPWLLLAAAIVFLVLNLFKKFTKEYKEECPLFLHHYASTPYLNTGNTLYRDDNLTQANTGWYSDGAHYYYQSGGNITSKLTNSTYAFIQDDPFKQQWKSSPNPASPTLVTEYPKLIFLAYTSGKPSPYCGTDQKIYYSEEFSETISSDCCDMQNPATELVLLPASASTDCVSVLNANNKAEQLFSASLETVRQSISSNYGSNIDDQYIEDFDVDFTHELKTELTPTQVGLYYDNRSGSIGVGHPLYYDPQGCQKALSGWYAQTGSAVHRMFFRVDEGYVTSIKYVAFFNSTHTTDGDPLITTNLDYTSNWFLRGSNANGLNYIINNVYDKPDFDPNGVYNSSLISAGYYQSSSLADFREFTSFNTSTGLVNTGSTIEAESGWYAPLNDWIYGEDIFLYQDTLNEFTGSTQGDYPNDVCPFVLADLTSSMFNNGETTAPQEGDRIYLSTGSNLRDLWTRQAPQGFYKLNDGGDVMYINQDGVVNEIRLCNASESIAPADLDPSSLRFNSAGSNTACTSSQTTVFVSGSFPSNVHSFWDDTYATTRAATGSYSDGTAYVTYNRIMMGGEFVYGVSTPTSCSNSNNLSSAVLAFSTLSQNGACGKTPSVRYWYEGSNWYNSTDLYSATSSGGGTTQAPNGHYFDGMAVNTYTNSSWGSAGLCMGGGPF